jgi:putative hydrolase of the HAD superfamily
VEIRAVVFDYGGVICLPPAEENREAMSALAGIPGETLAELEREYRSGYDRGTYDGREYYRFLLSRAGIYPEDPVLEKIAQTDSEAWKRIDPLAAALMGDLKDLGLVLGILSNMPRDFLGWARENIPHIGGAGAAVFSCELNTVKPERRIYEILRERLGCRFAQIVFFDDTPVNVEKATELGIRAFLWKGGGEARETLRRTGGVFAGL